MSEDKALIHAKLLKNGARPGQLWSQTDSRGISVFLMEADTVNPEETSRRRQR